MSFFKVSSLYSGCLIFSVIPLSCFIRIYVHNIFTPKMCYVQTHNSDLSFCCHSCVMFAKHCLKYQKKSFRFFWGDLSLVPIKCNLNKKRIQNHFQRQVWSFKYLPENEWCTLFYMFSNFPFNLDLASEESKLLNRDTSNDVSWGSYQIYLQLNEHKKSFHDWGKSFLFNCHEIELFVWRLQEEARSNSGCMLHTYMCKTNSW